MSQYLVSILKRRQWNLGAKFMQKLFEVVELSAILEVAITDKQLQQR